jgi:hypothetical protein
MSGGGGNSGTVRFAPYLEKGHFTFLFQADKTDWAGVRNALPESIVTTIGAMLTTSPYTGFTLTNPNSGLSSVDTKMSAFDSLVSSINPSVNWGTFVDQVKAKFGETGIFDPVDIEDIFSKSHINPSMSVREAVAAAMEAINDVVVRGVVKAFDRRLSDTRRQAINRFSGQMSDVNAVHSSAFLLGVALIEAQHLQSVAEFDSSVSLGLFQTAFTAHMEAYRDETRLRLTSAIQDKGMIDQAIIQSVSLIMQTMLSKGELTQSVTALATEINRIKTVATQEYELSNLDVDIRSAEWKLDTWLKGSQTLGMLGGGAAIPKQPNRFGTALGGALGGAGYGAMTGAKISAAGGPITAGTGALIGGILGLGAGLAQ